MWGAIDENSPSIRRIHNVGNEQLVIATNLPLQFPSSRDTLAL